MLGGDRICDRFYLIFGTSTGSIIGAMLALGHSVDEIHELYKRDVVTVMGKWSPWSKSKALRELAAGVFKEQTFKDVRTNVGVVTTNWDTKIPMIFKTSVDQA